MAKTYSNNNVLTAQFRLADFEGPWLAHLGLYDQKVNLVISAEVPPDQLYTSGAMAHEFVRTASRLHEMQSDTYRNEARRAQADRLG